MSNADSVYGSARSAGTPYVGAETEGRRDAPSARWVRPLLIALTAACALVLLGRFVGEPLTAIRRVTVHSDVPMSDEEILLLSGIPGGAHWYSVSPQDIEKRLEANPLVLRARVERVFPDTIRMTVWARQPAALVLASVGGRTIPVLVDGQGVVYKIGSSGPDLDLPVVSGLTAGEVSLGAALPRAYGALFADLRALHEKAPSLFSALSEVRIAPAAVEGPAAADASARPASPQDLELLVYLTSARVPIRTRGTLDQGFVKYALMVVDLLSRQGVLKDIQELDFRSGDVVYKMGGRGSASAGSPDPALGTTAAAGGSGPAGEGEGGMSR